MKCWSKEQVWEWYQKQPWIAGFNYVPSNSVNSTEMWQEEVFDADLVERELGAAKGLGFNTCRVFLQYLLWKEDREELFRVFDSFLEIADRHGIRVMPILFDDCAFAMKEPYLGKQDDPAPGIHNSCWTPSPGFILSDSEEEHPLLEQYVKEFITRYREDERILMWDLYNEPGNSNRKGKCNRLLTDAFLWARECDPTQPLTACAWIFEDYDMVGVQLSDIVSFHDYLTLDKTEERVQMLAEYGRPLICTEWLHRLNQNTLYSHMPYYKEQKIGIVNWGLVAGRTQTYLSWEPSENSKEGMPEIWQHDLFFRDLTPYRQEETDFIRQILDVKH